MKTEYRNVLKECGIEQDRIDERLKEIVNTFFYGKEEERLYFEVEEEMAYITDTGNTDVRTEGMSYGMMMCVQLNMKKEFDRLWKWAKKYMWTKDGYHEGYFAWSCALDGTKNADGPAPDGEEFFAMALFFAAHRWGNGEGIFHYEKEAKEILKACIHKGQNGRAGVPMWNRENYQILFVPGIDFTDPSYHLPHFYELFSLWMDEEEDKIFFKKAADASRQYLIKACHEKTGMSAEYAEFDGSPMSRKLPWTEDRHDWFYSDSYRTVANIGLDYEWFGIDVGQCRACEKIQSFLLDSLRENEFSIYEIDGTPVGEKVKHALGLPVTIAQGSLGCIKDTTHVKEWVTWFFEQPMAEGKYRYYDNCLYMFAYLALSGNYRIW